MATATALQIARNISDAFGKPMRDALQRVFTLVNADLLAVEARVTVIEPALVNCTASTLTVTAALHANKTVTINVAAGCAVTLPAATGTGSKYRFIIGTSVSSNTTVFTATGAHLFGNAYLVADDADATRGWVAAGSTTLTMNGTTKGGIKGDIIELEDVASNVMFCRFIGRATGTEVTPFA